MCEVETRKHFYRNTFIQERLLGNGVSGHVMRVRNKSDLSKIYAIKKMYEDHGVLEVYMLKLLNDNPLALKYIIEYIDSWIDLGKSLYIQMECCEMDLKCFMGKCYTIVNSTDYSTESLQMSAIQFYVGCNLYRKILACLNYIHTHLPSVIHCDLHLKNILVKVVEGRFTLKLADFAFSIIQDDPDQRQTDLVQLGMILRQLFKKEKTFDSEDLEERYKKVDEITRKLLDKQIIDHDHLIQDLSEWELTFEQLRAKFTIDKIWIQRFNTSSDRLFYVLLNDSFE